VLLSEQRWKYAREEQVAIAAEIATLRYVAFYNGAIRRTSTTPAGAAGCRRGRRPLDRRLALTPGMLEVFFNFSPGRGLL